MEDRKFADQLGDAVLRYADIISECNEAQVIAVLATLAYMSDLCRPERREDNDVITSRVRFLLRELERTVPTTPSGHPLKN